MGIIQLRAQAYWVTKMVERMHSHERTNPGANADIAKGELAWRAKLLVWVPCLIQIAVIVMLYCLYSIVVHPVWFGSTGVEPDVAFLSMIGCWTSQLLYHLWLKNLDKPYPFKHWTAIIAIATGLQVMFSLFVFLFIFPPLIHDIHWTPKVTTYFWQMFIIVLAVQCFALPTIMQRTVLELTTQGDQVTDTFRPK